MAKGTTEKPAKKLKDGFFDALSGVDSSNDADAIAPNALAFANNVTLRGGFPENRPGFKQKALNYNDNGIRDWWANRVFQGAKEYVTQDGNNFQVASVGGRLFKVDPPNNFAVTEITPQGQTTLVSDQISPPINGAVTWAVTDASLILVTFQVYILDGNYLVTGKVGNTLYLTNIDATPGLNVPHGTIVLYLSANSSILPTVWMEQAEQFMIVQDGQSSAIIFDGSGSRRASPDEVPVGTAMKYHQQRLWVAVNGNVVAVGDICSPTNTSTLLKFTEENGLTGKVRFRVGGTITGMVEMPSLDASLGQGPLQVLTADSFISFDLPINRSLWATLTNPFQTVSLKNFGSVNQNSVAVVNGDVFFRAKDGWRTFIQARREFTTYGNTPISAEMDRVLVEDAPDLIQFCSAILFDNRLLCTITPRRLDFNAYFNGIGALDFQPISSVRNKKPPIWEGLWTGIHPYQITSCTWSGQEHCLVYTDEPTGIGLWEISKAEEFDGDGGRIESWIEYPAFRFQSPMLNKKLQSAKLWVARIVGRVDFTLKWKVDDSACWKTWSTRSRCSTANRCAAGECYTLQTIEPGYIPHMGFGTPPQVKEQFNNLDARYGYQFLFRLEWVGHARLKRLLTTADEFDMQVQGNEDQDTDDR